MSNYSNPDVWASNYTLLRADFSQLTIVGINTHPASSAIEDLIMKFAPSAANSTCVVDASSRARQNAVWDLGSNYCTLYNLVRQAPSNLQYVESIDNDLCSAHNTLVCNWVKRK